MRHIITLLVISFSLPLFAADFEDNFESGFLSEWETSEDWTTSTNPAFGSYSAMYTSDQLEPLVGPFDVGSGKYEFQGRLSVRSDWVGFQFQMNQDYSNGYLLFLKAENNYDNMPSKLYRIDNGQWIELDGNLPTLARRTWHSIVIDRKTNGEIVVTLNNKVESSVVDTRYTQPRNLCLKALFRIGKMGRFIMIM